MAPLTAFLACGEGRLGRLPVCRQHHERGEIMRQGIAIAFVAAALLAPTVAGAGERVFDGALGAASGALVGGPVGFVAGGAVGFFCWSSYLPRSGVPPSLPTRLLASPCLGSPR